MGSGLLQVNNHIGRLQIKNSVGFPQRTKVVSFRWRTTALGYTRKTTVVDFKSRTLVVSGLLQYSGWLQMGNCGGLDTEKDSGELQMDNGLET